jgi:hypothetical protein
VLPLLRTRSYNYANDAIVVPYSKPAVSW